MSPRFPTTGPEEPVPTIPLDNCLAKRSDDGSNTMKVEDHLRLTGLVAEELLSRLPLPVKQNLPQGIATLAAVHDVGKVAPGYQVERIRLPNERASLPSELANRIGYFETKHSVIGESALRAFYQDSCAAAVDWAWAVGAHHGTRDREPLPDSKRVYGGPLWADLRRQLLESLVREFGPLPQSCGNPLCIAVSAGLVCVADWIASDETCFPPGQPLPTTEPLRAKIRQILDSFGFQWPHTQPALSFRDLFGFEPNRIQQAAYELAEQPGLLVIEAPMGLGKTEAALWAAYRLMVAGKNHGLYFALPTRITSNLIHHRVGEYLRRVFGPEAAARLLHAHAWLCDVLGGGEQLQPGGSWFAPAKRGLLWPFGVGTIDQALLGVVNVKHFFLRLFGLMGKVVILDEVHSYDLYTGTLLDALVERLLPLGCTVIVLSATLTKQRRRKLGCQMPEERADAYPLVVHVVDSGVETAVVESPEAARKTVQLRHMHDDSADFWRSLASRLQASQAVVSVWNTVRESQDFYRRAKSELPEGVAKLGLLHSNFPPWRRQELEDKWIQRLGKDSQQRPACLLVATQVVEQSVDVDADLLITYLAPTDLVLQRIGRLWRHVRPGRPAKAAECWLLGADAAGALSRQAFLQTVGPSRYVYPAYLLWRTLRVLSNRHSVELPAEIRPLLEATYVDPQPDDPAWVGDLYEQLRELRERMRNYALAVQNLMMPVLTDREEVATRYSTSKRRPVVLGRRLIERGSQVEVTLCSGRTVCFRQGKRDRHAAAELHENVVMIREDWLRDLCSDSPRWLQELVEKRATLFTVGDDGALFDAAGCRTPLRYTDELGLHRTDFPQQPPPREGEDDELQFDW